MNRKSVLIMLGITILVIAGILFGLVYYSNQIGQRVRNSRTVTSENQTGEPIPTFNPEVPTTGDMTQTPISENERVFVGNGVSFRYPANWGLLTCNNSGNFEFEPGGQDQGGVSCDRALKPITVLVQPAVVCQGETITLGGKSVTKSRVDRADGGVNYRYCVQGTGVGLDITHRVSPAGAPSSSAQDYSKEIEQFISTLTFTGSGGS